MPLDPIGKKLFETARDRKIAAIHHQMDETHPPPTGEPMFRPSHLTNHYIGSLMAVGRAVLDSYKEAYDACGIAPESSDFEEIKDAVRDQVTRAQQYVSSIVTDGGLQNRALSPLQGACVITIESKAKHVSEQLTGELEEWRLRRELRQRRVLPWWLIEPPSAECDPLTQLPNRAAYDRDIASAERPFALIESDIDHFKTVNDAHGHQAGDAALQSVAVQHQNATALKGRAYRWGGEEFVILLVNATEAEAVATAERIRESVEQSPIPRVGKVTASFGVAVSTRSDESPQQIHARADAALFKAKGQGRNRVVLDGAVSVESAPTPPQVHIDSAPQDKELPGRPMDIPAEDFAMIRKKCAADWPDNFEMRLFCETKQIESYRQLRRGH